MLCFLIFLVIGRGPTHKLSLKAHVLNKQFAAAPYTYDLNNQNVVLKGPYETAGQSALCTCSFCTYTMTAKL